MAVIEPNVQVMNFGIGFKVDWYVIGGVKSEKRSLVRQGAA